MTVESLEGFLCQAGPDPIFVIERDPACRMARISVNGHCAMGGNYWDFYPGCHGGWHYELAEAHGSYSSPAGMASALKAAFASKGIAAILSEATYRAA